MVSTHHSHHDLGIADEDGRSPLPSLLGRPNALDQRNVVASSFWLEPSSLVVS